MKEFPFPSTILESFFPIWKSAQINLSEVVRWKPFLKDGIAKEGIRPQNVLQHTHSFSLHASFMNGQNIFFPTSIYSLDISY